EGDHRRRVDDAVEGGDAPVDHVGQLLVLTDPHDGRQVDVTGDRVDLGDPVDVGDLGPEVRDAVRFGVDQHECGQHARSVDPVTRRPGRAAAARPRPST